MKIQKEFYFDITELKAKVNVSNSLLFQATEKDDVNVNAANCTITLNSKYDSPFVVESVILQWENESPIIIEGLSEEFSGEGNHTLKVSFAQPVSIEVTSSKTKLFLQ